MIIYRSTYKTINSTFVGLTMSSEGLPSRLDSELLMHSESVCFYTYSLEGPSVHISVTRISLLVETLGVHEVTPISFSTPNSLYVLEHTNLLRISNRILLDLSSFRRGPKREKSLLRPPVSLLSSPPDPTFVSRIHPLRVILFCSHHHFPYVSCVQTLYKSSVLRVMNFRITYSVPSVSLHLLG